ncbi:MAG: carboxypeptidase-like regulatory domain-containing protein, partial [Bacteroidia bacterium]|nr:carboxypeptidase-like regulatory domain-containing protein [Bacteroidia bacterium]
MKKLLLLASICFVTTFCVAQDDTTVKGIVIRAGTDTTLENVNIVNLNQVLGTATNVNGEFEIRAKANDTLHFSYLGYKSIRVRVTNDWINFAEPTTIEMTELALALEEVIVNQLKLTGYLEVDIKQVPLNQNVRYSISGLPTTGYEGGTRSPGAVTKV